MSSDVARAGARAIAIDGIGKRYTLGMSVGRFRYRSLRETVSDATTRQVRRLRGTRSNGAAREPSPDHIWALRDVSFSVAQSEVVGIIGRNGAGKSTLLKILSRITKPTVGTAELRGRVGTLLEVGTGFHPELSGADNIYLSGTILGMIRAEIQRLFDEMVAVAGIEKFIDTPVKRYSSGMYVRLAFAVAAHLQPEILLVDEVLAVGDAEFQRKCLGKMQSVVHEGRTVLFVSHNMAAIKALCPRAILLDGGRVVADGSVDAVVDKYLLFGQSAHPGGTIPDSTPRTGTGIARLREIQLLNPSGAPLQGDLYLGQPVRVVVSFEARSRIADAVIEIGISTIDGTRIVSAFSVDEARPPLDLPAGDHLLQLDIHTVLIPRTYSIDVGMHHAADGYTIDLVERALDFTVLNVAAQGADAHFPTVPRGFVRPQAQWIFDKAGAPVAR